AKHMTHDIGAPRSVLAGAPAVVPEQKTAQALKRKTAVMAKEEEDLRTTLVTPLSLLKDTIEHINDPPSGEQLIGTRRDIFRRPMGNGCAGRQHLAWVNDIHVTVFLVASIFCQFSNRR